MGEKQVVRMMVEMMVILFFLRSSTGPEHTPAGPSNKILIISRQDA